jgi:hypothetical protein
VTIFSPRPFWLIVNHRSGGMEVLTIALASGEEALPVFSFEDEASMFLDLGTSSGWRIMETTPGELASALSCLCAGVGRVVLDPLPGPDAAAFVDLVSMEREDFVESLLNARRLPSFFDLGVEALPSGRRDRSCGGAGDMG